MTTIATPERNGARREAALSFGRERMLGGPYLFFVRVLNYVTNHVIAHVPSYTIRHLWYRRVLGIQLARDAGIHMSCHVWFYGPGGPAATGCGSGADLGLTAVARWMSGAA